MTELPDKKYRVIYADPPWEYQQGGRGAAKNHYHTMKTDDICKMPIQKITGGGLFFSFGQLSQTSGKPFELWRRGASSIRRLRLCG